MLRQKLIVISKLNVGFEIKCLGPLSKPNGPLFFCNLWVKLKVIRQCNLGNDFGRTKEKLVLYAMFQERIVREGKSLLQFENPRIFFKNWLSVVRVFVRQLLNTTCSTPRKKVDVIIFMNRDHLRISPMVTVSGPIKICHVIVGSPTRMSPDQPYPDESGSSVAPIICSPWVG